jgi:hypothetical protein
MTTCGPTRQLAPESTDLVEGEGHPDTRLSFCHFDAARLADLESDVVVL